MTTNIKIILGGGAALLAWLVFRERPADVQPDAASGPKNPPPKSSAAGVASDAGVVGNITYHADGSVTECEEDLWSGSGKVCKRFTAAEWAAKESAVNAALDAGLAESDAYSILTYAGGVRV